MTLVEESRGQSDFDQRGLGPSQLSAGEVDAKLADILANAATVMPTELTGKVNGVNVDRLGNDG
jgi:hypothetical protein